MNRRCANGSGFDKLNPTASGRVGLSLRRVVGFGGRVRGGKPSTNETTNSRMDDVSWESLRTGWACPCGGLWVSAGASVGENRPRMKPRWQMDDVQMGVVSTSSTQRLRGGGLVPAAGCGFWRARLWGKSCAKLLAHCATFARAPTILLRSSM